MLCSDHVHVAAAVDRPFVMPLGVMVRSVIESLAPGRSIHLHVIDCGLSATDRRRLLDSWPADRLHVDWLPLDRLAFRGLPLTHHFSRANYARLLIPRILPACIDKVIYLDADTLVLADVGELWAEPLHGAYCLAVQDVSCPWIDCAAVLPNYASCRAYLGLHPAIPNFRELGFAPDDPYFNSGLMVIDLDRWRADDVERRVLTCLETNRSHVRWLDQYGLNVVLRGRWRPLDLTWNQGAHILTYPDPACSPFDFETLARCRFAPRMVHFTTGDKPWLVPEAHPFSRRFFEVLDRTAWRGWRPPPRWRRPFGRVYRRLGSICDRALQAW